MRSINQRTFPAGAGTLAVAPRSIPGQRALFGRDRRRSALLQNSPDLHPWPAPGWLDFLRTTAPPSTIEEV